MKYRTDYFPRFGNCHTIIVCFIIHSLLLAKVFCFSNSQDGQLIVSSASEKDGLHLAVSVIKKATDKHAFYLFCEITNISSEPATRMVTSSSNGFRLRLYDIDGNEIQARSEWLKYNLPESRGIGKRALKIINPGDSFQNVLSLNDAYGINLSNGVKLIVDWNPGRESAGLPIIRGRGLSVDISIPSITFNLYSRDDNTLNKVNSLTSEFDEGRKVSSVYKVGRIPYYAFAIFALIVFVTALTFWLKRFKRRS